MRFDLPRVISIALILPCALASTTPHPVGSVPAGSSSIHTPGKLRSSVPARVAGSTGAASIPVPGGCTTDGNASFVGGGYNNYANTGAGVVAGSSVESCDYYTFIGAGTANIVGSSSQSAVGLAYNSAISGGFENTIAQAYQSFIGAGQSNAIGGVAPYSSASNSSIAGGENNAIGSPLSFIGGGEYNSIVALNAVTLGQSSIIGGGYGNAVSGNFSAITSGRGNSVAADYALIGAGLSNAITSTASYSAVDGGSGNAVSAIYGYIGGGANNSVTAQSAIIGGGQANTISGLYGAITGGEGNAASGSYSDIGGGYANQAGGQYAFIGAGYGNVNNGTVATISGGYQNTASGRNSTVPGGAYNSAGGVGALAAGYRANAANQGAFVWNDDDGSSLGSTASNQFLARASGGFYFYSSPNTTAGVQLAPGSGAWSTLSDRAAKTDVTAIDNARILEKIAVMPVSEWSYRGQGPGIRHLGPMAQDFRAAFGLGEDDRHISTVDEEGVALAAIKALQAEIATKNRALAALRKADQARFASLERRLTRLESREL